MMVSDFESIEFRNSLDVGGLISLLGIRKRMKADLGRDLLIVYITVHHFPYSNTAKQALIRHIFRTNLHHLTYLTFTL